jgi:hypothetical protein
MPTTLVTKLPSAVSDTDLLKINQVCIKMQPGATKRFQWDYVSKTNFTFKVKNGYFTDSTYTQNLGKTYTSNTSGVIYLSADVDCVVIESKNGLKTLYFWDGAIIDLYDLNYLSGLQNVQFSSAAYLEGDLKNLVGVTPLRLSLLLTSMLTIEEDSFKNLSSLSYLSVTGTVTNTFPITYLKYLTSATTINLNGSGVTGTAAELEAAMRAQGRTSGSLYLTMPNGTSTTIDFSA